jgi:hypothetical protein
VQPRFARGGVVSRIDRFIKDVRADRICVEWEATRDASKLSSAIVPRSRSCGGLLDLDRASGPDRTGREPHQALGDAAHDDVIPAPPPAVRAAHEQIDVVTPGVFEDFVARIAPRGRDDYAGFRGSVRRCQEFQALAGVGLTLAYGIDEVRAGRITRPFSAATA